MDRQEIERGPQMQAQMLEKVLQSSQWNWEDVEIDTLADLLRYIEGSHMTVQEFMQLNLYKQNVGKVPWLKSLDPPP